MTTADIHTIAGRPMLDELLDRLRVVETAIETAPRAMSDIRDRRPGAYLHLYVGDLPSLRRARRPRGGRSSGTIAIDGGYPIYAGSALSLAERTRRHVVNLTAVTDLSVEEIQVIALPTESFAGARYAEQLLIEAFYTPVFNCSWLSGFGSRRQGGTRERGQKMAPFNIAFPGRIAVGTDPGLVSAAHLHQRMADHLDRSIPDICTTICTSSNTGSTRSATILPMK